MSERARPVFVVAPTMVVATVVATLLLGAAGTWVLLRPTLNLVWFIVAVILFWGAVNVLVVGLVSATAWHGHRTLVAGEIVRDASLVSIDLVRGWHRLVLHGPGTRVLHGFVSLRAAGAAKLAERLAALVGCEAVALDGVSASDSGTSESGPAEAGTSEASTAEVAVAPASPEVAEPLSHPHHAALTSPAEAPLTDDTIELMRPRRALDWDAPASDQPHHAAAAEGSDDEPEVTTMVLPRRAMR